MGSCNKNSQQIPYVPVDIYMNISLPSYSNLGIIGGWVYVSGGNSGLLVYRQSYESIVAYDRYCTYNLDDPCGYASVDSSGTTVLCDCDGTSYTIYDGSVISGPATYPLFQYRTTFDVNSNQLHIYN